MAGYRSRDESSAPFIQWISNNELAREAGQRPARPPPRETAEKKPRVAIREHRASAPSAASLRRPASTYGRWVEDWWLWEILSTVTGLGAIVGICVILKQHDGEPVPSWGQFFNTNVTLNSVLSILATLARASLIMPVLACMSQLKWMHYAKNTRPLGHLEVFDDASRGALGAAYFLWRFKGL